MFYFSSLLVKIWNVLEEQKSALQKQPTVMFYMYIFWDKLFILMLV